MALLISSTVMLFVVLVAISLGEHWHQQDLAADRERHDAGPGGAAREPGAAGGLATGAPPVRWP